MPKLIKKLINNKYFIVFLLGSISALVFAPTYFFPAGFIGFCGLFLILDKFQSKKESFLIGWFFGFGHFLFGFYWISISLFTDFTKFGWLLPFSISLIPAAAACYIGLAALLTNIISHYLSLNKIKKILLLAIIWVFAEWLRTILFSGFPWNLIGYSLGFSDQLLQNASYVGIYGLSIIAMTSFTSPALLFELDNCKLKFKPSTRNFLALAASLILLISMWAYGDHRLNNAQTIPAENGKIRIVQSNIKQSDKWSPQSRYDSFYKNVTLSKNPGLENINYVIWSEAAIPYILSPNSKELLDKIQFATPKDGFIITGALRAEYKKSSHKIDKAYNSIFVIDDQGQINDSYDKNHLVPFGEYIPLAKYLPFISKITYGDVGFSTGTGSKTIKPSDASPGFSPLICYEIIFPGKGFNKSNPPEFLVNLTNDAWFGSSSGPYQHFAMTKMRAIEYGVPIIRTANTGISALIDPYGRPGEVLGLNEEGILDVKLMKKLSPTPFIKYGFKPLFLLIYFTLLFILRNSFTKES